MPELRKIPILSIAEPPVPMREAMDEQKLADLAASMQATGLIQPIVVKGDDFGWEIVAGHRRYLAARSLGWTEIECKCYAPDEVNSTAAMLAENIYREDLSDAEEALWFADIMELKGIDTIALAGLVHKSQDYVEDRLRLFRGDEQVFDALRKREVNFAVARELNKFKDEGQRRYFLSVVIARPATARQVQQWRVEAEGFAPVATGANGTVPVQEDAPAPAYEAPACKFCGGNKDPYNMEHVLLHRHCFDYIVQAVETARKA